MGGPPPEPSESDEELILDAAQSFLRKTVERKLIDACLNVIDNGGILNPCVDDLRQRKDWQELVELDPKVTVTGFHRNGEVAVLTTKHLEPATTLRVSLEIVHTEYGPWRIRKLNGKPIEYVSR